MKVEIKPSVERGQLPSVCVDGVRVGFGSEKACRRLAAELEADESKQKSLHDYFLLQDIMSQ
jgi:hypothetical protein